MGVAQVDAIAKAFIHWEIYSVIRRRLSEEKIIGHAHIMSIHVDYWNVLLQHLGRMVVRFGENEHMTYVLHTSLLVLPIECSFQSLFHPCK